MATNTWSDIIAQAIIHHDRPLLRKEVVEFIELNYPNRKCSEGNVGSNLSEAVKKGRVYKLNIKGFTSFYCIPSWIGKDDQLKKGLRFDPHLKILYQNEFQHQ